MEFRDLGDGLDVTALGLGLMGMSRVYGAADDDESIATIRAALDAGVTLFDNAEAYGGGHSAEVLGPALAGRRDEAVVTTKFGLTFRNGVLGEDGTPENVRRSLEGSLQRMGMDHVDLLPPGSVRLAAVWINDVPYADFDADALTVKLPPGEECRVKVWIMSAPTSSTPSTASRTARRASSCRASWTPTRSLSCAATRPGHRHPVEQVVLVVKEVELGTDAYVVGACEGVAASFVEVGDAEAAGGDFCRADDESEIPA